MIAVEAPCTEDEHQCRFGTPLGGGEIPCIPEENVCDGIEDCFLGTDEENCTGMQHCTVFHISIYHAAWEDKRRRGSYICDIHLAGRLCQHTFWHTRTVDA